MRLAHRNEPGSSLASAGDEWPRSPTRSASGILPSSCGAAGCRSPPGGHRRRVRREEQRCWSTSTSWTRARPNTRASMRRSAWGSSCATSAYASGWTAGVSPPTTCKASAAGLPTTIRLPPASTLRRARRLPTGPGRRSAASTPTAASSGPARRAIPSSASIAAAWSTSRPAGSSTRMADTSPSLMAAASGGCAWSAPARSPPFRPPTSSACGCYAERTATTRNAPWRPTVTSSRCRRASAWASTWGCASTTPIPTAAPSTPPTSCAVRSNACAS